MRVHYFTHSKVKDKGKPFSSVFYVHNGLRSSIKFYTSFLKGYDGAKLDIIGSFTFFWQYVDK